MKSVGNFFRFSTVAIAMGMVLLTAFHQVSATAANATENKLLSAWAGETDRTDQSPGKISSRWIGATRIYDMRGFRIRALSADEISSARWLAMAHFYEDRGLLTR